jgi:hypothetical protein
MHVTITATAIFSSVRPFHIMDFAAGGLIEAVSAITDALAGQKGNEDIIIVIDKIGSAKTSLMVVYFARCGREVAF